MSVSASRTVSIVAACDGVAQLVQVRDASMAREGIGSRTFARKRGLDTIVTSWLASRHGRHRATPPRPQDDSADLARFGYQQSLHRRLHFFSSFAAAFSYISPATGIFTLFILGVGTLGGAFIWTWPVVALGQFIVALNFAEVSAHFPVAGSVFQWTKLPQRAQAVRVVLGLDLPVGGRADGRGRRRDAAADADPDASTTSGSAT